jgi:hypothetical protein
MANTIYGALCIRVLNWRFIVVFLPFYYLCGLLAVAAYAISNCVSV